MIRYYYVKEKLHNPDIGNYTSYAISAYKHHNHKQTRIAYISDVFLNEMDAKKFVHMCNTMDLDPVHLLEVLEEAIIFNQQY